MKSKQKPGVVFQPRVHQALQRGIYKMVNAIRPTLGPLAGGVAMDYIYKTNSLPEFLDDGGVIARRIIELPNRDEDMGAMLVRSMVCRQHERIGDGTATVAVIFEAVFNAGLRYIAAGGNAMQLRRYLEGAIPPILDELDKMIFWLDGQEALTKLAYSLCHDAEMAAMLGEIFELIGEYGRLEIRKGQGRGLRREYVEGTYYNTGLFSRVLLPDDARTRIEFTNPAIFLSDFEVSDHQELFPVLQVAHDAGVKALVIITRNLSEKPVSLLVANNNLDKFKVIAIKLPGLNPADRMAALDDLAFLTGATPILKVTGDTFEGVNAGHFGQARRVWADLRSFGIIGGRGNPRQLREHIRTLEANYHGTQDTEQRRWLQGRIGKLLGGSATLWVGGFTEPEISARQSLAERVSLTMRVAVEQGIVPGGGIALLNCRESLQKKRDAAQDSDERAAYNILLEALAAPARTIFSNAGYDPSEIMAKLNFAGMNTGFDVVTNAIVDICEAGILDSAFVVKSSVRNAISTAALALTIDSLVHLSNLEIVRKPE